MLNKMVGAVSGAVSQIGSATARAVVANGRQVLLCDVMDGKGRKRERELGTGDAGFGRAALT